MSEKVDTSRRKFLKASGALAVSPLLSRFRGTAEGTLPLSSPNPASTVPVIDCHTHAGIARLAGTATDLTDPWNTFDDPEKTLRRNAEAGIDVSVIFPNQNVNYEKANEDIAELCRRYPGKFIGFARHCPHEETEKGRIRSMLFREVHELGLRGLGELHCEPNRGMLDAARELGIPVLYHPKRVALYEDFVPDYPDVNFILCHLGSDDSSDWREHLAGIQLTKCYPNVYMDTSTVVIASFLEKAIRELPAEKLLFGSDGTVVDCRMEIYKIRVQKLPKEKEQLILGGNILRLLGGRI
jgi:uncharacterized protein